MTIESEERRGRAGSTMLIHIILRSPTTGIDSSTIHPNETSYMIFRIVCIAYFTLCLSTTNIVIGGQSKKICAPCSLKKKKKYIYCGLFAHPISQHVYWSRFDLGGWSCRSGREAVSQYHQGARICGSCGGVIGHGNGIRYR